MPSKLLRIIMAMLRGIQCPDCKSRNVIVEKSTEIDPARIPGVLPLKNSKQQITPMMAYADPNNCYQKVPKGDIFKTYRDNYRCALCNCEFKRRREILVTRGD